jgi:hypothetical protein
MSGPSFSNIDRWFFEYIEGNLSPEQEAQLEAFILNHPELELDLDAWKSATIEPTYYEFPDQNTLLQPEKKKRRIIPFYWSTIGTISVGLILFFIWPNDQSNNSSTQSTTKNNKHSKANYPTSQNHALIASKTSVSNSKYTLNHPNLSGIHLQPNHYSAPLSDTLLNSSVQTNIEVEDKLSLNKISINSVSNNEDSSITNQLESDTLMSNVNLDKTEQIISSPSTEKVTNLSKNNKNVKNKELTLLNKLEKSVSNLNEFMEKSVGLKNTRDHQVHVPGMSQIDANFSSAGDVSSTRFRSLTRAQWVGKENQQLSNNFSLDWYSKSIRSGFAVQGKYVYYSNGVIQDWNTALVYSPKIALSRSFLIEPAIRFKMGNKMLDGNKVSGINQVEIDRTNSLDFYPDGSTPIGKLLWYKDIGASLLLHSKWFYAGFQMDNLLHHQDNIYSNNVSNPRKIGTHLNIYAGTDYESKSGNFAFAPYFMYDQIENRKEAWGGFNFQCKALAFGGAVSSKSNLAVSLGLRLQKFSVTYQFDNTHSQLLGYKAISHQLGITINSKVSRTPRRYIRIK